MTKIKEIKNDTIYFENGYELYFDHNQDCCEHHYLHFEHIEKSDYENLEFNLNNENFFTRIPYYGIQLNAQNNFPLIIPSYDYNNGYYSSNLTLILKDNLKKTKVFNITECQEIND